MNSFVVCSIFTLSVWHAFSSGGLSNAFESTVHDNRIWVPLPDKKRHQQQQHRPLSQAEHIERQYNKENYCFETICDRMVRHAQELSRLKLIRRYVRDTVGTLDRLVTALDAELIAAGQNLQKSFGESCRSASVVLNDVTEESYEFEGFR